MMNSFKQIALAVAFGLGLLLGALGVSAAEPRSACLRCVRPTAT